MQQRQSHRRTQRYSVHWSALCTFDGKKLHGRLRNVSTDGALLELDTPAGLSNADLLELTVHTDFGPMHIQARQCWNDHAGVLGRSSVGLRFIEDPEPGLHRWYRDRWYEQLAALN